ncbi:MAG: PEP-CTERM sorting domain-containing protein [Planctomycetota bacterium]
MPTYSLTVGDAITGDNEFTANGGQRWNVDSGADNYFEDFYERPTAQTYENRNKPGEGIVAAANEYFGYLDIKEGKYGYDDDYMYFQITLNTGVRKTDDGTVDGGSFGSGTFYGIRLSGDPDGADGLLLRVDGSSKELWGNTFDSKSAEGYFDADGDIGGPGGITTVNENPGSMTGYEATRIESDGGLSGDTDTKVLFSRIIGPVDGQNIDESVMPVVEIAFAYKLFNQEFANAAVDPANLQYLEFEADRGLKDNANYLWNDKYSFSEAGTPYDSNNSPQNVYELDTVRLIPEPGSAVLLLGLAGLAWRRR